ncbi:MAG: BamA/TamA family outer membrane protein [Prolixibacteraceae bacterium]|nr:BamA/TamA family outer membrane protein [Prolixibacteraceae bacterium]
MASFFFASLSLSGQRNKPFTNNEEPFTKKQPKSGFAWGGTPVLAFDPDLGLKYGALINLFDYGDGTVFPDYDQYAFIRLFHSTGGTSNLSLLFESETLIPDSRITFESSYIKDIALDFYGFNGLKVVYQHGFSHPDSSEYINRYFYKHQRELIRLRLDWQTNLPVSHWKMFFGLAWNRYLISDVDDEKLNKNQSLAESNSENMTLYQLYNDWGIIHDDEKSGGNLTTISLGFTYDSRNNKINCSDGTWFESYFILSPPSISSSLYLKHIATLRHYLRWSTPDAVIAFRLSSQQLLHGKLPFYALPVYHDTRQDQDGLGGAFNLRGIYRNRIAANGFLLGNIEMRKNIFSFNLFKLNWDIDLSVFTDAAYISREYKVDNTEVPGPFRNRLFNNDTQKINFSYGGGLYIIYNANNIISVNYGIAPNRQLGTSGIYIGSSFLF